MTQAFNSTADVIIRTGELSRALTFYTAVLGFKAVRHNETLVEFNTGSFRLFVDAGKPHGPVFELLVPDVSAARANLLAAGCELIEDNPAVPRCYMRDPYGFTFNVGNAPAA